MIRTKRYGKRYGKKNSSLRRRIRRELVAISETKVYQVSTPGGTIGDLNRVSFHALADVPQGATQTTRTGDKILLRGLKLNVEIKNTFTQTLFVRAAVFSVYSLTGTADVTNLTLLFRDADGTAKSSSDFRGGAQTSKIITANFDRSNVMLHYDKVFKLGVTEDSRNVLYLRKFIKLIGSIVFNGNNQGAGAQNRRIYLMLAASSSTPNGAITTQNVDINTCLMYKDP